MGQRGCLDRDDFFTSGVSPLELIVHCSAMSGEYRAVPDGIVLITTLVARFRDRRIRPKVR